MAESLTEDIFIEILLRLPIKSLMRFKCVGKRWRSLISDPAFAKSHLQRLKAGDIIPSQRIFKISPLESIDYEALDGGIGGGGGDGDGDGRTVVEFHEPRMKGYFWKHSNIVGSCDGLVCLTVFVPSGFLVYNPTTKESRDFPDPYLVRQDEMFRGFGYDSESDDYKIVQGGGSDENWQVAIFSLKSGSWRRIQVQQESRLAFHRRGVYWNGALHWLVVDRSRINGDGESLILSFDLSEEKFRRVLSVPEVDGNVVFGGLGIHGASLFIYKRALNCCFEAWITNEHGRGGSWTKLFSVLTDRMPGFIYRKIPIAYTGSGKIVFQIDRCRMVLFDPEDNTCKDYPIQTHGLIESAIYLETLVSPYLGGEPLSRCKVKSLLDEWPFSVVCFETQF